MPPGPPYYVYILSNQRRTVLYIGMTNGLRRRLREHRNGHGSSFVDQYNVTDLVYYERYDSPRAAVEREKQLKRWRRGKKDTLIQSANPDLESLSPPLE